MITLANIQDYYDHCLCVMNTDWECGGPVLIHTMSTRVVHMIAGNILAIVIIYTTQTKTNYNRQTYYYRFDKMTDIVNAFSEINSKYRNEVDNSKKLKKFDEFLSAIDQYEIKSLRNQCEENCDSEHVVGSISKLYLFHLILNHKLPNIKIEQEYGSTVIVCNLSSKFKCRYELTRYNIWLKYENFASSDTEFCGKYFIGNLVEMIAARLHAGKTFEELVNRFIRVATTDVTDLNSTIIRNIYKQLEPFDQVNGHQVIMTGLKYYNNQNFRAAIPIYRLISAIYAFHIAVWVWNENASLAHYTSIPPMSTEFIQNFDHFKMLLDDLEKSGEAVDKYTKEEWELMYNITNI